MRNMLPRGRNNWSSPMVMTHARLARNVWALARGKLQKLPNMTQDFFPTLPTAECKS